MDDVGSGVSIDDDDVADANDVGSGVSVGDGDAGATSPDMEVYVLPSGVIIDHRAGSPDGDADAAACGVGAGDDGVGARLPDPRIAPGTESSPDAVGIDLAGADVDGSGSAIDPGVAGTRTHVFV